MPQTGSQSDSFEPWLKDAAHSAPIGGPVPFLPGVALLDGRFVVERVLGRGGMGVVYTARDNERGEDVALKTLLEARPDAIYRFKQEFRSLADVVHSNLVRLHGLYADGASWFFTMELLQGAPLLEHLYAASRAERLRAFAQLVDGVEAIHRAGKLHRDLKPSNVLVTPEGRVVILDFGLAVDPLPGGVGQTLTGGGIHGTPAYMAPEQAAGRPASAASDWYALGVMLYETLCGELPFGGQSLEILANKQLADPPTPSTRSAGVEPELERICMRLLSRDSAARPGAPELRQVFGRAGPAVTAAARRPDPGPSVPFVGRDDELAALHGALAATDAGVPVCALVRGISGIGKTALVERFLDGLADDTDAVLLRGRCYQQEAIPLNALDRVIDDLSRHLRKLPEGEARSLLSADAPALARAFPALARLDAVHEVRRRIALPDDATALRALAHEALKELLIRMAQAQPLVVFVDDLQWGDAESARLLQELLAPPRAPALLFVGTYRAERTERSAFLQVFEGDGTDSRLDQRRIELARLSLAQAGELAVALGAGPEAGAAIASESGGHPLFVQALARDGDAERPATLEQAIERRIARLDADSQRLLELAALAGRPTGSTPLLAAADRPVDGHSRLERLMKEHLLRSVAGEGPRLCCFHDRVREIVAARLRPEAARARHAELARALEACAPGDEPQAAVLAYHWAEAGEHLRSARWHVTAARQAGDLAAVIHHRRRVCELLSTLPPDREVATLALRARIAILRAAGPHGFDEKQAEALFAEARDLAEAVGDQVSLVKLLFQYANSCMYAGDAARAVPLYAEAAGRAHAIGDERLYGLARTGESWAHLSLGNLRRAFEMNLELWDRRDEAPPLGFLIRFNLRSAQSLLLEHPQLALAADGRDPEDVLEAFHGRGHLEHFRSNRALLTGHWEAARRDIARARELAKAMHDMNLEISTFHAEADMLMRQERYAEAREVLERALAMSRAARTNLNLEAMLVIPLARAYAGLELWERAEATARTAIEIAQQRKARHHEALARIVAAQIAIDGGGPDADAEARANLERAAALIEQTEARAYLPWLHEARASLCERHGDPGRARAELLEAAHWHRRRDDIFHAERAAQRAAEVSARP